LKALLSGRGDGRWAVRQWCVEVSRVSCYHFPNNGVLDSGADGVWKGNVPHKIKAIVWLVANDMALR